VSDTDDLAEAIDRALPQTQCRRCDFPDCRSYAQAIAEGRAEINQCPPGGAEGIERLSRITGRPVQWLNPAHGTEGPLRRAVIDESWCIGCTLCLKACPVDCIVGGPKLMHTVIEDLCTGCDLCLPVCPVDCIAMVPVQPDRTGWQAWSSQLADEARERYAFHRFRVEREQREQEARLRAKAELKLSDLSAHTQLTDPEAIERKRAVIEAALARSRARQA
jgi:Na+-translocating ferredoxin:NAD+ oxidoreductase subunit B